MKRTFIGDDGAAYRYQISRCTPLVGMTRLRNVVFCRTALVSINRWENGHSGKNLVTVRVEILLESRVRETPEP
jgi:hypothetical protein